MINDGQEKEMKITVKIEILTIYQERLKNKIQHLVYHVHLCSKMVKAKSRAKESFSSYQMLTTSRINSNVTNKERLFFPIMY